MKILYEITLIDKKDPKFKYGTMTTNEIHEGLLKGSSAFVDRNTHIIVKRVHVNMSHESFMDMLRHKICWDHDAKHYPLDEIHLM